MNFLLVDGSYYVFYRYYAMHQWWKNAHKDQDDKIATEDISRTEIFVNAFKKAFVSKFREISKKLKLGKHVVMVGKDCHRKDIWRMKYYPSYKAQREYEDNFEGANFFKLAYDELYAAAGATTILEYPTLEADDCIAITVKHILNSYADANIYVITSDTDYLQLACDRVHIFNLKYQNLMDSKSAYDSAEKNLLCKIITGDKTDNILPIFKGCGPKTAVKLYENKELLNKKLQDEDIQKQFDLNSILIDFNNIPTELVTEFRKKVLKIQTTEEQ